MGRFDTIKTTIDANIKENGSQEITGQKMNSILTEMVNATDAELTELESETISDINVLDANILGSISHIISFTGETHTSDTDVLWLNLPPNKRFTIKIVDVDGTQPSGGYALKFFSKEIPNGGEIQPTAQLNTAYTFIKDYNIIGIGLYKESTNVGKVQISLSLDNSLLEIVGNQIEKNNIPSSEIVFGVGDVIIGGKYIYEIHSECRNSAWVGFYDVNGSEILLIGKTKYGNATKIRGEITIPNNFHVAKTQNSGIPIPFFSLASGNVAKLKDIETKNALYANSLDIAQRVYSTNERILSNNDVTIGNTIYFDIEAVGTLGYISLFDTENNVIAHYGKTSSTSEQYRYRGKFIIPNGFSHIEVDGNADVIVHSMSTIEINEQHYDSDYFVFYNQFSHIGNLDSFNGLCCTDYLYIKGAMQLRVSNLPSSVYNVVEFFDESYQYISSIGGQIENPINEVSVIPPINATYCRVNGNMDFMGSLSVIIVGAMQEPNMGLRFNPIMSHDTINNVVPIFERGDINDLVLSRIPAAYKSGNLIYSVCEKRENNSDAGRIAIMLSCYNITNGDNVKKVILQSDDNIRYMNPIVYYDDYNILSAYAKRLYVFAIKVIGGADITELNSKDEADCIYIYSDDNGKTWSGEQSLKPYYPNDSIVFGTSPSSAIVVDNTLILPAFVVYGKGYSLRSGIISFTKGESSFKMSQIVNDDNLINNECSVVPYGNRCCLFARNLIGDIGVYCTSDLSSDIHFLKYWSDRKFKTFTKVGCQIDVKAYKGVYFMTNIDIAGETDKSTGNRKNLSLYGSFDMKKWYPLVRIEKEKVFGYAVIIPSEQTLHVLYEDGDYQGISLCELTEWADKFIALKDEYINEQALYVIANR